jgi:hypothetical protein
MHTIIIMVYTKKSNTICRFETIYTQINVLVILCSPKCKVFEHVFLHVYGIKIVGYIMYIFHKFKT